MNVKLKLLAIFLLMIIISCNSFSNKIVENSWVQDNLRGKVKNFEEVSSDVTQLKGRTEKKLFFNEYNEKGYAIEKRDFRLRNKKVFKYDNKGNRVQRLVYSLNDNGSGPMDKMISEYDDDGNLVTTKWSNSYSQGKWMYKYDENGNQIEFIEHHRGKVYKRTIYKYNEKGEIIQETLYNTDNLLVERAIFDYDKNGNKILINMFAPDERIRFRSAYKYDDRNNRIEEINFLKFGDDKADLEYAIANDLDKYKEHFTYAYEYDNEGNWVKKTKYNNGEVVFISEREYTYYE
ncbi:hypothetical protein PXD56_04645 [Maribacter sp. SA7]|uniref:hypothetical protein n=1 Tax=Maribacter zhoushanensis TaxID=3030012 RepID=UPI0023EB2E04|nr:hypothetical protein [Maribacter zhoushanensis]MDF4202227.1 hypothetical protein [Maribacter zhoushanensis]